MSESVKMPEVVRYRVHVTNTMPVAGQSVDVVLASAHLASVAALEAENKRLREIDSTALEIVLSAAEAYVMQVGYRNVGRTTEAIESLRAALGSKP